MSVQKITQVIANNRISCKKSYNEAKLLNVLYRRMVIPDFFYSGPSTYSVCSLCLVIRYQREI